MFLEMLLPEHSPDWTAVYHRPVSLKEKKLKLICCSMQYVLNLPKEELINIICTFLPSTMKKIYFYSTFWCQAMPDIQ